MDTGDYYLKKRTMESLYEQSSRNYCLKICPWNDQKNDFVNRIQISRENYYLFLQAGTRICQDAVKKAEEALEQGQALWYYADEEILKPRKEVLDAGSAAKPGFGMFGFASHMYTGNAVLFSGRILSELISGITSREFPLFLMELTIKAAAVCDGVHMEFPLLMRDSEWKITEEHGKLLNQWMSSYLNKKELPFFSVLNTEEGINHLYCRKYLETEPVCPIVVVADETGQEEKWKALYQSAFTDVQVFVQGGHAPWGMRCNEGIRKADGEAVLVVRAGWMLPNPMKMKELLAYACSGPVGMASPRLYDRDGKLVYAGGAQVGYGFNGSPGGQNPEYQDYRKGVRETMVPGWQFSAVNRLAWEQAGGFSEKALSPDFCAADFALRLKQNGFESLYCGNIAVRSAEKEELPPQQGFLHMLEHWGKEWGSDRYFTEAMRRKVFGKLHKGTRLFVPEQGPGWKKGAKNILVLSHELSMTGAPVVLTYAVEVLQKEGFNQLILSPEDGVLKENMLGMGVPVLIDEDIYENDRWLSYAREFDLIVVNTVVPFFCIKQLENFPVPVIWWIHDAREGYVHYLRHVLPRTLGSNIDVYCVSEYARDVLREFRPQYESGVFLYGLPDFSEKREIGYRLENPDGKYIFLTVGTIESRKGQDVLLQAIDMLGERVREKCLFCFIGGKKTKIIAEKLERSMLRYPDTIQWIPFLNRTDIFDAYRQASAVICASRDDPLPAFMTETMMMSGVCICSENTGTASLIESGRNGFVYRKNSPKELAACIARVAEHGEDMDRMRAEARRTYEEKFEMSAFREELRAIVEKNLHAEGEESYGYRRGVSRSGDSISKTS